MSEREIKKVPINLLETVDKDAPIVEEMHRQLLFLDLANRALRSVGVVLVGAPAAEVEQVPNLETIDMDEAAAMMSNSRLDELAGVRGSVNGLMEKNMTEPLQVDEVLQALLADIDQRTEEIKLLAQRPRDAE